MLSGLFSNRKKFHELSEKEVLALAISAACNSPVTPERPYGVFRM